MSRVLRRGLVTILAATVAPLAAAQPVAVINVNVVPMTAETLIPQQTVIVDGQRIVAIGPVDALPIPDDAEIIDGTDRYLLPGLAEMHAHVPAADSAELDRYLALYVANGVTLLRGMLGQPSHLELREALARNEVFGPRLVTSGPSLNGRSVNGADDAVRQVEAQHAAGYDFLKLHPGLSGAEFEALVAAANRLDMPFAGHVPVTAGLARVLQLRMRTIDHLDGYFAAMLPAGSVGEGGYGGFFDILLADDIDPARLREVVQLTAASQTWIVPTEVLVEQLVDATSVDDLRNRGEMRFMPQETVAAWAETKQDMQAEHGFDPGEAQRGIELRRRLIAELHAAGARLLLGADSPQVFNVPGFATHRELGALVAAGLSPYEALRTGTAAVAEFLGSNGGTVAVGRDADLVLLDANPLADISNARRVHGVLLRGRWYSAAALDERLARFAAGRDNP